MKGRARCACGNKFPPTRVTIRKPRPGTRCSVCCCHRLAIVVEITPRGSSMAVCARCLASALDYMHELSAAESERQTQRAIEAGHDPQ